MLRDKDKALAEDCRRMAEASVGGLDWIHDNQERVGVGVHGVQRSLKKHAVEARRLAQAAERPMSVGVFGASQAGKSFLIGALIAPEDRESRVVFGTGEAAIKKSFLEEVNPQGGDETTGLVTRFSITPQPTPQGYEVALRMLREIDIVKILANTFLFDLSAEPEAGAPEISEVVSTARAAATDRNVDALVVEDAFAVREYFEKNLYRHPLARDGGGTYWSALEELLPRLKAEDRAGLLSPLWGGYDRMTELYLTLKDALDRLGHPAWAYAPLSAIEDRAHGILHVGTLYGLDTGSDGAATVTVQGEGGATAALPKPVVTALTAELRVTLDAAPWPFFENTDLLDFPGARSRLESSAREWLDPARQKEGRAQCFLRGKVAVLFDNYAAELDLNTMLLCVGPENQEVRKLPELVEGWIGETHGRSAKDRIDRRVSLFLCLTKADKLFDVAAGSDPKQSVRNRLSNNLNFYPGWTLEWTPGRPFDNTFLIRNPNFQREDLFDYGDLPADARAEAVPPEAGIRADKEAWLDTYKTAFLEEPLVLDHVGEPETRWRAMLALNDGGISHLAERLLPVCDPDLKFEQIRPRAETLRSHLRAELASHYEEGDIEKRVAERTAKARDVRTGLRRDPERIGRFMAELMADPAVIGQCFLAHTRRARIDPDVGTGGGMLLDDNDDLPGDAAADLPSFGRDVLEAWLDALNRKAGDDILCRAFGLTPEQFLFVVEELRVAARRLALWRPIDDAYHGLPRSELPDELAPRIALGGAIPINAMVATLGVSPEDAPANDQADIETVAFPAPPATAPGDPPPLEADARAMLRFRGRYPGAWTDAIVALARNNAAWSDGGFVDPEQNARLGRLIDLIEGGRP